MDFNKPFHSNYSHGRQKKHKPKHAREPKAKKREAQRNTTKGKEHVRGKCNWWTQKRNRLPQYTWEGYQWSISHCSKKKHMMPKCSRFLHFMLVRFGCQVNTYHHGQTRFPKRSFRKGNNKEQRLEIWIPIRGSMRSFCKEFHRASPLSGSHCAVKISSKASLKDMASAWREENWTPKGL